MERGGSSKEVDSANPIFSSLGTNPKHCWRILNPSHARQRPGYFCVLTTTGGSGELCDRFHPTAQVRRIDRQQVDVEYGNHFSAGGAADDTGSRCCRKWTRWRDVNVLACVEMRRDDTARTHVRLG